MKLLNYLPNRKVLVPAAFKAVASEKVRRLWLSTPCGVSGTFDNRSLEGVDNIMYGLQVHPGQRDPGHCLETSDHLPSVAHQSPDMVKATLDEVQPKRSFSVVNSGEHQLDLRAVSYICGAIAGMCGAGIEPAMGDQSASAIVMSPAHTLGLSDRPTLTNRLWKNDNEWATLTRIMKLAGADDVNIMGEVVPRRGKVLKGEWLGVYAVFLQAHILATANECGTAAAHAEAYSSGMIQKVRPISHSDEGGIIRKVLRTRKYPTPRGIIYSAMSEIAGMPLLAKMQVRDLTRYVVGEVLEDIGRYTRCDPTRVKGQPTGYRKDEDAKRPSDLDGFNYSFYEMTALWRKSYEEEYGIAGVPIIDEMSCNKFFDDDEEDEHLKGKVVFPFIAVEASGVSVTTKATTDVPVCHGSQTTMPMLRNATAYKTAGYNEYNNRPTPGSKVLFVMPEYTPRVNGINYLMSATFCTRNGLSQFQVKHQPSLGGHTTDFACADNSSDSLANRRWSAPHNPFPHPAESRSYSTTVLQYTYIGAGKELTASQLSSGTMHMALGPLVLSVGRSGREKVSHSDIPDWLTSKIDNANEYVTMSSDMFDEPIIEGVIPDTIPPPAYDYISTQSGPSAEDTAKTTGKRDTTDDTTGNEAGVPETNSEVIDTQLGKGSGMMRPTPSGVKPSDEPSA